MKFITDPMAEPLLFSLGDTWTLVIQRPSLYRHIVESLHAYYEEREPEIHIRLLDDSDTLLDVPKSLLIVQDSYAFDASARSISTALTKDLVERSVIDEVVLMNLEKNIMGLMGELELQTNYNLLYKPTINLVDLVKMMGVRLAATEQASLIDKMYSILEIARNLLAKHLVIFVNHRCLVTSEEFVGLMDFAKHIGQSVLYIDCTDTKLADSERRLVIDGDMYCYKQK